MTPEQTVKLINLLTEKRMERRLSINEVARRANVDPGTAWRIEQGMIAKPRADSLIAIGRALGINTLDLFTTAGWLTADDLPDLHTFLRAKFDQLPEASITDIEQHVAAVLHTHSQPANEPHAAAAAARCPQTTNHCPQCPCSPKER